MALQSDQHAALLAEAFAVFNQTSTELASSYHELESQVAELSRELDAHKRLAAVGEVAATLAHQLRTPLASALLYLAPLERGELEPAAAARYASKTLARLRQIEAMVNDMLTFTRGGRGGSETVAADELINAAAQVLEPQLDTAALELDDASGGAVVSGNREALVGAILNVVNNALEAAGPRARVSLRARQCGVNLEITVSDNGPGIAASVRERVFEPFFTTRTSGTGLGLAIVRSVVEAHGGSVCAASTPAGAVFTIRLPLAQARMPLASGAAQGIYTAAQEACS